MKETKLSMLPMLWAFRPPPLKGTASEYTHTEGTWAGPSKVLKIWPAYVARLLSCFSRVQLFVTLWTI